MSSLIERVQGARATSDERPRVLDVEGEETDEVLDALATDTRRALFRCLFEKPRTPSEIADRVDTSVQNVTYHLSNLETAGLVEAVDTRYSEKGNEMTVYAPANDPIVLVGDGDLRPRVQRSLSDVLAGLGILGIASLFVQWGAERLAGAATRGTGAVGPASRTPAPTAPRGTVGWLVFDVVEPGVLFFFLCLALVAVAAVLLER